MRADGSERPESFTSRNIKVITFAVCMVLFLGFCGPVSFFRIRDCAKQRAAEELPELTVTDVIGLFHDRSRLTTDTLRTYRGVWNPGDKGNTYTAEFGHYILLAFEDPSSGIMTFCEVTDLKTDERLDLLDTEADPEAFFGKN